MEMDKQSISPYIRRAIHSTLTAPFRINERIIFDYELILVAGGMCRLTVDDVTYICKKNDVILLRPGVSHIFECVEQENFVQPHIHFDVVYTKKSRVTPISFKPKSKMSEYELSLISKDFFEGIKIPYVFKVCDHEHFQKLFYEIIAIFEKKAYNYELFYKSKMMELLGLILLQFEEKIEGENVSSQHSMAAIKSYIDNNFSNTITLDGLSKQFYINKYTMMRNFKAVYQKSIIAYYHDRRIEYAKKKLQTTTLSVYDIGESLQFNDIYSFSRFFKMYTGCSPTAYRKAVRNKEKMCKSQL